MKKITLIELTVTDTQAIGVRVLSSVARSHGFDRDLIFMCGDNVFARKPGDNVILYDDHILDQVVAITEGSCLVGISFLTNFFDRAVQVTEAIKKRLDIPVIWGGVHATARPDEAFKYVDMVCMGESENSFGELLDKIRDDRPYTDTAGIWFKTDGAITQNPWRPQESNLDTFPFQDYELEGQYFYNKLENRMAPLTYDDFKMLSANDYTGQPGNIYNAMMTRGCPSTCSFCYNSTWRDKYNTGKYVRSRSVDNMIAELSQIRAKFPFVNFIRFADDNFFAKSGKIISEFAERYSKEIGVPFWVQVTPTSVDERRIETLIKAGLRSVSMGVQTASGKISEIYNRSAHQNTQIVEASRIFSRLYKKYESVGMRPPEYDFILDSFWEAEEDAYANIEMLLQFQKPYRLHLATLIPYPGTKIYERVKAENLIKDEMNEVYRRPFMDRDMFFLRRTFPNLLMVYFENLPNSLVKALINEKTRDKVKWFFPKFLINALIKKKRILDLLRKIMTMIKTGDFAKMKIGVKKVVGRMRSSTFSAAPPS